MFRPRAFKTFSGPRLGSPIEGSWPGEARTEGFHPSSQQSASLGVKPLPPVCALGTSPLRGGKDVRGPASPAGRLPYEGSWPAKPDSRAAASVRRPTAAKRRLLGRRRGVPISGNLHGRGGKDRGPRPSSLASFREGGPNARGPSPLIRAEHAAPRNVLSLGESTPLGLSGKSLARFEGRRRVNLPMPISPPAAAAFYRQFTLCAYFGPPGWDPRPAKGGAPAGSYGRRRGTFVGRHPPSRLPLFSLSVLNPGPGRRRGLCPLPCGPPSPGPPGRFCPGRGAARPDRGAFAGRYPRNGPDFCR